MRGGWGVGGGGGSVCARVCTAHAQLQPEPEVYSCHWPGAVARPLSAGGSCGPCPCPNEHNHSHCRTLSEMKAPPGPGP